MVWNSGNMYVISLFTKTYDQRFMKHNLENSDPIIIEEHVQASRVNSAFSSTRQTSYHLKQRSEN